MYNEYSHTSPIHTFIHPWHQYFHMYIHNIFIHNINSYTFALVVQNIVFNRVLPVRVSLIIVSSRKLQQMNVLHLSFILFQATSPTQWTAWVYLLSCFQATSPKQRTAWVFLPFILFQATSPKQTDRLSLPFYHVPFQFLTSVIPSVYGQEVSLKSFVSVKLPFQTNTMVDCHFP